MPSVRKILFSTLLLFCFTSAFTQSHWEISASAATYSPRSVKYQPKAAISSFLPQVSFGRVIVANKGSWKIAINTGWQRIRGDGEGVHYMNISGVREKLSIDNLVLGGGLEYTFCNQCRYRVVLGENLFFGIPLRADYQMVNTASPLDNILPLSVTASGGGRWLYGHSFYTGLLTDLSPNSQLKLKLGVGSQSQRVDWDLPSESSSFYTLGGTKIVIGGFWLAGIEFSYRI